VCFQDIGVNPNAKHMRVRDQCYIVEESIALGGWREGIWMLCMCAPPQDLHIYA
jgi:hypothetical protein